MENHSKDDFEGTQGYDSANESPTIEPQGLSQRLENNTNMLSRSAFYSKKIDKLSYKMPAFVSGILVRDISQNFKLIFGDAFTWGPGGCVDFDGNISLIQPAPAINN